MYIQPNKERLKKLDLSDIDFGESILFCKNCDFQVNGSKVAMKSQCPECGTKPLNITRVDDELIELVMNYFMEQHRGETIVVPHN